MKRTTTIGKMYAVTSAAGCTVTTPDGLPICTVEAGTQGYFTAPTSTVEVDDDAALLTATFNRAALALGLLGGGVTTDLPAGYLRAEFLESTGTQYITLPQGKQTEYAEMAADIQFTQLVNNTGMGFHYYMGGWWGVKNNKFFAEQTFADAVYSPLERCKINFTADRAIGTQIKRNGEIIANNTQYKAVVNYSNCCLFGLYGNNMTFVRIYNAQAFMGTDAVYEAVCALDEQGAPCMYDKARKKAFYNSGTGQFIAGFTISQARKLGKHLPEGGGSLTVSLPCEAQLVQYNAEVEASLQTAKSKGWTITVQYREPEADSAVYNKYAACTTYKEMVAINPNYKNDLTSDGEWIYPLTNLEDGNQLFNGAQIKKWGIKTVPKVKNMFRMFYGQGLVGDEFECEFPSCTTTHDLFAFTSCRVFRVFFGQYEELAQTWYGSAYVEEIYGDFSKIKSANLAFYKCLKLRVLDADWLSLSSGNRMFDLCELPKTIVLRVLNTIPAHTSGSHPLTIGIHVDHQADEEVLAAISEAEAKGWALTVQWNGKATASAASTYGLRRNPVYAKLGEPMEDGKQHLDWGHYVTNWEENGYTEFASLDEAQEYFNIGEQA